MSLYIRACSSVGRAFGSHPRGRGFESLQVHQIIPRRTRANFNNYRFNKRLVYLDVFVLKNRLGVFTPRRFFTNYKMPSAFPQTPPTFTTFFASSFLFRRHINIIQRHTERTGNLIRIRDRRFTALLYILYCTSVQPRHIG